MSGSLGFSGAVRGIESVERAQNARRQLNLGERSLRLNEAEFDEEKRQKFKLQIKQEFDSALANIEAMEQARVQQGSRFTLESVRGLISDIEFKAENIEMTGDVRKATQLRQLVRKFKESGTTNRLADEAATAGEAAQAQAGAAGGVTEAEARKTRLDLEQQRIALLGEAAQAPKGVEADFNEARSFPPGSPEREAALAKLGKNIGREITEDEQGNIIVGPAVAPVDKVRQRELKEKQATLTMVLGELRRPSEPGAPSAEQATRGGVGGISNILAAIEGTVGQVVPGELFPDNRENRQALRQLNRLLTQSLVLNRRFPVAEQNAIKALIPTPEEFFKNPAGETKNIRSLTRFIEDMLNGVNQELGVAPKTPTIPGDEIPEFEIRNGQLVPVQRGQASNINTGNLPASGAFGNP